MIFVPLPLFATLGLLLVLLDMVRSRDMIVRANQIFMGLVALYAVQSLFVCLRWGYELGGIAIWIAFLAPILPIVAYFAYLSLIHRLTVFMLWPLGVLGLNWAVLILMPDLADPVILLTYLGFGIAILRNAFLNGEDMALVRIARPKGPCRR